MVLGSGGPQFHPERASSGYLVLVGGVARLLVDAGGGVLTRIGQVGVDAAAIDVMLITHLHPDHSGEVSPVLWAMYLAGRKDRVTIIGPGGRDGQVGIGAFVDAVLGPASAWGTQLRTFETFGLSVVEWPSELDGPDHRTTIAGVEITAAAVRHGPVPALAYRVQTEGGAASVTFSGDVDRSDPGLIQLARETHLLVHAFGSPERQDKENPLLARPSEVGRTAAEADCRALLLSHLMEEVEEELDASVEAVRGAYKGSVEVAVDLSRHRIGTT